MGGGELSSLESGSGNDPSPPDRHSTEDEIHSLVILNQWEFQDPKMVVPTIYKAYIRPM